MKRCSRLALLYVFAAITGFVLPRPAEGLQAQGSAAGACPPLPPATGDTITVSTVAGLVTAVDGAGPGDTILAADGTYHLDGAWLGFSVPGVTLRSASGNREAVVLDGDYVTGEIVQITASNVTIADLTLREAFYHPIHVSTEGSDVVGTLIYNVHIVDPREQAIKINPGAAGGYPDDGVVACSHIEMTDAGRPHVNPIAGGCYTGGVDAHQARGWVIRDNLIAGFWCPSGLSEHAIHMWMGCRDTVVERNVLRDNARGVGFGMVTDGGGRVYADDPCPAASGYVDHVGGVVRNNVVFVNDSGLFGSDDGFDCGICLWNACQADVLHNTVASTSAPFSSIEWRFSNTSVDLINNLVTHNLMDRGGTANQAGNLAYQPLSLFVDGANGDLHLAAAAAVAIDQGVPAPTVSDDLDGDPRPIGGGWDVGADEYGEPVPPPVTDLRLVHAITGTGTLTAALRWTPSAGAVTVTLRYSGTHVTPAGWGQAVTLTDTLAGESGSYTAVVPYTGGVVYWALKSQNHEGDWSDISNNGFWPQRQAYLPLVLRDQ